MSMLRYPPTEIRLTSSEVEQAGRYQRQFTEQAVHSMTTLMRSTSIRVREGPQHFRDEALRLPVRTILPQRAVFCFISEDSSAAGLENPSNQRRFLPRNRVVTDSSAEYHVMRRVNHRRSSPSQEQTAWSQDPSGFSGFETTSPSSDSSDSDGASPMSLDGSVEILYRGLNVPSTGLQLSRQAFGLPRSPLYQTQGANPSPTTRQPSNESSLLSRGLHQTLSSVPMIETQRFLPPVDSTSRPTLGSYSTPDLRSQSSALATSHSAITVVPSPIPERTEPQDEGTGIDTQNRRTEPGSSCRATDAIEELRKHRASPLDYVSQIAGSHMSQAPTIASLQSSPSVRLYATPFRFPSFSTQDSSDSESSEYNSGDECGDVGSNEQHENKSSVPQTSDEKTPAPKGTPLRTPATFKPYNDALSPSQQPQTPASHLLHRKNRSRALGNVDRPILSGTTSEASAISEASSSVPSSPSPSPRRSGSKVLQTVPDEQTLPISAPHLPPPVIQSAQAQQHRNVSAEDSWLQQQRNLNDLMRQQRRHENPMVDPRFVSRLPFRHQAHPSEERSLTSLPPPPGPRPVQHIPRRPRERPLVPPHIPPRLSPRGSFGHMRLPPAGSAGIPRPRPSDPQMYHPASRQTQFRPVPPAGPRNEGQTHFGLPRGLPPQLPIPHLHPPPHRLPPHADHPQAHYQHQQRPPPQHFRRPPPAHGRQQPRPRQQDHGEPRHQQENSDDALLQTLQAERARFIERQGQQMAEVRRGQMERTPPPGEGRLERYLRD